MHIFLGVNKKKRKKRKREKRERAGREAEGWVKGEKGGERERESIIIIIILLINIYTYLLNHVKMKYQFDL